MATGLEELPADAAEDTLGRSFGWETGIQTG